MSINVQIKQAELKDLNSFVWSVHEQNDHKGFQPPQSIAKVIAVLCLEGIVVMADASINGRKLDHEGLQSTLL